MCTPMGCMPRAEAPAADAGTRGRGDAVRVGPATLRYRFRQAMAGLSRLQSFNSTLRRHLDGRVEIGVTVTLGEQINSLERMLRMAGEFVPAASTDSADGMDGPADDADSECSETWTEQDAINLAARMGDAFLAAKCLDCDRPAIRLRGERFTCDACGCHSYEILESVQSADPGDRSAESAVDFSEVAMGGTVGDAASPRPRVSASPRQESFVGS